MHLIHNRRRKAHLFFTLDATTPTIPAMENHAHSHYSDGSSPLAQVVLTALEQGLTQLIMTEHTEPQLTQGNGWFGDYMREGREIRGMIRGRNLNLVLGLEVPITDFSGGLLWDEAMKGQVECVLGAVHAYPGHGWNLTGLSPEEAIDLEYRGLLALLDNPLIDAIAHPGGVCQRYVTPFPDELFEDVVRRAVEREIAVELNPAYLSPMAPYLDLCRRHGAMISPGSNAHALREIGLARQVLNRIASGRVTLEKNIERKKGPGGLPHMR
ncbi:MAG: hypothetical protein HQL89_17770 [Magnetococcales bacterium]|nr:hypothetical protein [Magnetococcales bacterium]